MISVPSSAKDGSTVTFSATTQGGTPTAFLWTYSIDSPGSTGNNPQVNFSSPTSASTTALAHWYARPNVPCATGTASETNPYYNSKYKIKVKVTFQGGSEITKSADFVVNAWWNRPGTVGMPDITGAGPTLAPSSGGMWVVTGPGTLSRVPQQTPTMSTPSTSQFYSKVLTHENVHIWQWNQGILQNYVTVSGYMALISGLTSSTQDGLELLVNQGYNNYLQNELNRLISSGDKDQAEIDAYTVSDPLAPMYAYQRCGRTVFPFP